MANKETRGSIASGADEAKVLLVTALQEFRKAVAAATDETTAEPRVFFPNGIELISIKVTVSAVTVELKVAGEKGIKGLLAGRPSADGGVPEAAVVEQGRA